MKPRMIGSQNDLLKTSRLLNPEHSTGLRLMSPIWSINARLEKQELQKLRTAHIASSDIT